MAFKMKAGKEGPMKKNFPSAFKDNGKVKVFGGKATVDTSTPEGKKIAKEIKKIPTVSSSDPNRITKMAKKFAKGASKAASKVFMGGIINPTSTDDPRITEQISKTNKPKIDTNKTY
tara:strand:+ start:1459 stop:1809 length:351 start_codon:yes stop_codon:yes gene_type:complete